MSFDDENEFAASPDGSSDDEQNERMEDVEEEREQDDDGEGDEEEDGDGESEEERNADDGNTPARSNGQHPPKPLRPGAPSGPIPNSLGQTPNLPRPSTGAPTVTLTSPSPKPGVSEGPQVPWYPSTRPEALTASVYDIVPTIAAPHSTSINTVAATPDLRWVFSGGSDGYIRKFNWVDTVNGKVMLTVAQRHPFVDSVTKAGSLVSYWENEEPSTKPGDDSQSLSPVYSLAVHNQALWLLSGLESGAINLQSVRHDEGKRIHCLKKHVSAVSVLNLSQDERSVLSGSWDRTILDWDLNTGHVIRTFEGNVGQISAIEMRPSSSLPIPEAGNDPATSGDTLSRSLGTRMGLNATSGAASAEARDSKMANENGASGTVGSPTDSLFGGNDDDSLFGDNDDANNPSVAAPSFGEDYDDEFSRAIANGIKQHETADAPGDISMMDVGEGEDTQLMNGIPEPEPPPGETHPGGESPKKVDQSENVANSNVDSKEDTVAEVKDGNMADVDGANGSANNDSVFLSASIDGSLRVWDKRKPTPVAKVVSRNAPPWCMGACWSPDGNFIYAGRRNGTVEEFSVHRGFRGAERTFRFPNGSGPVSAVRVMPNGRHLMCASYDILRLYDLQQQTSKHSTVPFLIVPGHRTGVVSQLYLDPTCRFMLTAAGNRGWEGASTQVLLGYEINV